ncbi:MAG: phytanoyl-CoA dioxygenase family protein [Chloroflexi bacterium]|nr:phytanoyl-CoA dioxygenase family protein [Chloroflexota bacterium]MCC6892237.1 phytanoyl-CoA dioxygenase family protein [Anaerolineae bacterium]
MSTYALTPEQLAFYDANGYLLLRNWIPQPMLERLQAAGDTWIADGMAAGEDDPQHGPDYRFVNNDHGRTMWRVDYLHNKGLPASLELLGSPVVTEVAQSMCGVNFVPTYEAIVFKQEGNGAAVEWHQDAVHPRTHRIFNYDLYLDESLSGAGALWVIPGSHLQSHDVCRLSAVHGWNAPGAIEIEMQPGDVLLHDVMVLHGSPQTEGKRLRRTIYYEFRAAEEIVEDGPWDRTWIDQRLRLVPLGLKRYAAQYPQGEQFQWQISDEFRPEMSDDEATELRVAHQVHMNGSYCSAGDAAKLKAALQAANN